MKRFVTCEKVFDVSVFHFMLCDTRRGNKHCLHHVGRSVQLVPIGHVDTVERADLVPVPLHVLILLKLRANPSGSSWWTATNHERKDERMDRLGRVTTSPHAREFGTTKCRVRKKSRR